MVGVVRFELTASRAQDERADQPALHPDIWWPLHDLNVIFWIFSPAH